MIKDIFESFKDNVRHKTANPFFGTFIAVWIFKNWVVINSIFNFDSNSTLDNKIAFIRAQLSKQSFFLDLFYSIVWTFLILIVSYVLLNLSRLIINFFEKRISPIVYRITDSKDIVLKSDYDKSISENDRLKDRFVKERENRLKAEEERDNFEKRITELTRARPTQEAKTDKGSAKIKVPDGQDDLKTIAENLKQNGYFEKFESTIVSIDNKKSIDQKRSIYNSPSQDWPY